MIRYSIVRIVRQGRALCLRLATGGWRLAAGDGWLAAGGWRLAAGGWRRGAGARLQRALLATGVLCAGVLCAGGVLAAEGAPPEAGPAAMEAFEVGLDDLARLPRGKEADGIAGDFVLRNGLVEALVSGNRPGRKANMTTHYHAPTAGCLFDLSVQESGNDQLTLFAPGGLEGQVSSVRVVSNGADGGPAVVLVERTAALGDGLAETHEYRLEPGARHLLVVSRYANQGRGPVKLKPQAVWKGLSGPATLGKIRAADAMDPMDRQGYATAPLALEGAADDDAEAELKPGERRTVAVAMAPGRSPAEALGVVASLRGPTGLLKARVLGPGGRPVRTAAVTIPLDAKDEKNVLAAYPDPLGRIELRLPPGAYELRLRDHGRPSQTRRVELKAGETAEAEFTMPQESRLSFEVTGAGGENLPCKAQIIGLDGTPDPDLGPTLRAHGCRNQYHSETGWFSVAVDPGRYRVVVTRGIEYDHHVQEVVLKEGRTVRISAALARIVDTRGWVSTDFHNHSTPSGDNYCGTDDRLINLAAEHVEFAPTTEHNRFYDWAPHLRRLGLAEEVATVVGIELTGPGPHLNAFPFRQVPGAQDGGAPTWSRDPRINAMVLRDWPGAGPERWVQINHPSVGEFFRDRDADGVPDAGFSGLERFLDAAEVWSEEILNHTPVLTTTDATTGKQRRFQNRTFAWLQLLNQGRRMWCVAVSDAHEVFNGGVGGWRTYVPSSTDEPARIDLAEIVANARAGRMTITNGPFLEASLADGTPPGGSTISSGPVELRVRVQTNRWVDIDRVQVLVNGRQRPDLNFTRAARPELFPRSSGDTVRFEASLRIPLNEDSWIIAVAAGEASDLSVGYGKSWQGAMRPRAYHNPIYVDIDGDGFRPNGDTLGHPLPVAFPHRRRF